MRSICSRRRLQMERIDLVYVHDLGRDTHGAAYDRHFNDLCASGLPALAAMKAAGAIGGFGIGVNSVDAALVTLRAAAIDVLLLAGRYTLADQSALAELLPECARRGVTVVLGGVFNSGILATGTAPGAGRVATFDYAPAAPAVLARVAELAPNGTISSDEARRLFGDYHAAVDALVEALDRWSAA